MPPSQPLHAALVLVAAAAVVVFSGAHTTAAKNERPRRPPTRLLPNVKPLEYSIRLQVDHERPADFLNGSVDVYVEFPAAGARSSPWGASAPPVPTRLEGELLDTIVLSMDERVSIKTPRVTYDTSIEKLRAGQGRALPVQDISLNTKSALLALKMAANLPAGSYGRISVEFFHEGGRQVAGLDRCTMPVDVNGGSAPTDCINIALQPSNAHRVFPCFDVPRFRVKVLLIVEAASGLAVYSNMPVVNRVEIGHNRTRTVFRQSPRIPIHKLALSIGPYDELADRSASGAEIRLAAPRGMTNAGRFALQLAKEALDWLASKLASPHPTQKLVIIATNLTGANVTEALGCILVQQEYLLIDPGQSSPERMMLAALNVAQAVAQQWFGNMVSPARWIYGWILDGVAAHMALAMLGEIRPNLGVRHYVHSRLLPWAMRLKAVRAMRDFRHPATELGDQAMSALEPVKSASIMSMLQTLVGRDQLLAAIRTLLATPDGLVTLDKLTEALAAATNNEMTQAQLDTYLATWIEHSSFPLISVGLEQHKGGSIVLYQSHIEHARLLDADSSRLSSYHDAVQLRIKLMFSNTDGSRLETVELPLGAFKIKPTPTNPMSGLVKVPLPEWFDKERPDSGHWVKLVSEPGELPFYCVRYTTHDGLVDRMGPAVKGGSMSVADRVNLLNHANTLTQISYKLLADQFLEKVLAWIGADSSDSTILAEQLGAKQSLSEHMSGCIGDQFCMLPNFRHLFEKHRFETPPNETTFEQFVRGKVLLDLVADGDEQVIGAALDALSDRQLAPFLREPVYAAVAHAGTLDQLRELTVRLKETVWFEERARLEAAFKQTRGPDLVQTINSWSKWFRRAVSSKKPRRD